MCAPSFDPIGNLTPEQRMKWAQQKVVDGDQKGADFLLSKDKARDTVMQQILSMQNKVGADAANKMLAPDAADAVIRKTGTSALPQQPSSRKGAFSAASTKYLLGSK